MDIAQVRPRPPDHAERRARPFGPVAIHENRPLLASGRARV